MCESKTCPCHQHVTKIKLDFLDIFIEVFSVNEEQELDTQWPDGKKAFK